jgi:ABC-type transport system involved in multi-copper enzyme maturation permease subunit
MNDTGPSRTPEQTGGTTISSPPADYPPSPSAFPRQTTLLHYRPWRGQFHSPTLSIWPVARIALWMIFRRKLFWALYALGLLIFFMFFFGQYMLAWAESQTAEQSVQVIGFDAKPQQLIQILRDFLKLNGSAETYRNFFWYQGYMVMVVLALTGSILVGNDFHFGTLPFYLSKPLGRWHYLVGKCLAVGVFINLMTTLPALILFVQYGLLESWGYFVDAWRLMLGILGYGLLLTVCLSLMLVAAATWLRRTVPLIMTWTTLFFFFPLLSVSLVEVLHYDPRWRLIDMWNNTYLLGNAFLGVAHDSFRRAQPAYGEAALVLGGLVLLCLIYLNLRIRAVEVVK